MNFAKLQREKKLILSKYHEKIRQMVSGKESQNMSNNLGGKSQNSSNGLRKVTKFVKQSWKKIAKSVEILQNSANDFGVEITKLVK